MISLQNKSDLPTKNNECVLHRWIKHNFIVVYIIYYTFDEGLMNYCRFTRGTILYKKIVSAMCPFRDDIAGIT